MLFLLKIMFLCSEIRGLQHSIGEMDDADMDDDGGEAGGGSGVEGEWGEEVDSQISSKQMRSTPYDQCT